ncbi:uncharacterized protein LOC135462051 isoform X2 [Liolophura sinensis]|uniref:uncharacterized protein LOC135462051 isoform X2 n=1 Tax=Liolophura sinensis TaxID=3198878 RepID=UPI003157F4B0
MASTGQTESTDTQESLLHDAARLGHTKKLKRILTKGISVDFPNTSGQSPLFSACYNGQLSAVLCLLKHGANPNERSVDGATPVHAACYSCNVKIVSKLLGSGGDLRLHDNLGRTPKDWIMLQSEPKKKYKMIEFIEKTRYFAMGGNSKESIKGSSSILDRASDHTSSVIRFVKGKIKRDTPSTQTSDARSVHSMGFGKVYLDSESWQGMISIVPLVGESSLRHDNSGFTFNNGSFMVMESMIWLDTDVTVKRLHRKPQDGGHVDLLINESEFMGKIHHPNVLLFMGICQTNNLDGLVLLYERISCGSLFHYLHDRFEGVSYTNFVQLLLQICGALVFIHRHNLIHCSVSSHAVNLITPTYAKLGNFEYMVECSPNLPQKKSLASTNTFPNAVYNWLAPELMEDQPPVMMSDMYGLCMVIYEVFEDKIPWEDCSAGFIKQKLVTEGYSISCKSHNIPKLFQAVLELGLQFEAKKRKLTFEQLQHLLVTLSRREDFTKAKSDCDPESPGLVAVSPVQGNAGPSTVTDQVSEEHYNTASQDDGQTQMVLSGQITIPDIHNVHCDRSANNSSSDFAQYDEPSCQGASDSCSHAEMCQTSTAKQSSASTSKALQLSSTSLKPYARSSFLQAHPSGSVDMYKDKDDTFHYSVCLSRKTSRVQLSPRNSTGSPSTLPRCKRPSFHGEIHRKMSSEKRHMLPSSLCSDQNMESLVNSKSGAEDCSQSTSHYTSMPSVSTFQQNESSSPSALYKAVSGINQPKQPVEIVRDIKAELAKSRERKAEANPFRTPTRSNTVSCNIKQSPPVLASYSNLRSSTYHVKPAIKPASHGSEAHMWENFPTSNINIPLSSPKHSPHASLKKPESTSPAQSEKGESPVNPEKSCDTRWFGGLGSVKNLVKKYQAETDLHQTKQAVLEGKLTSSPCHKDHPSGMFRGTLLLCQTKVSVNKSGTPGKGPSEKQISPENLEEHKIDSHTCSASTSVAESDKCSIDSDDSGEILAWVKYHLERIKENMTHECPKSSQPTLPTASVSFPPNVDYKETSGLSKLSSEQDLQIEVLPNTGSFSNNKLEIEFSNTTTATSSGPIVAEDQPESSTTVLSSEKMPHEKPEPEEFYFDDVIQPSLLYAKHLKLQGTSSVPDNTSSIARTVQRGRTASEDRRKEMKQQSVSRVRAPGHNPDPAEDSVAKAQVGEPAPHAESNTAQIVETDHYGHTTILSVRSSGKLPGKHTITHTETDLKTGITETVSKGTVRAQKVVSQVYTE